MKSSSRVSSERLRRRDSRERISRDKTFPQTNMNIKEAVLILMKYWFILSSHSSFLQENFFGREEKQEKQVPRGYIRCDYFIVTHHAMVFTLKNSQIFCSKITGDGRTDGRTDERTDEHDLL